MPGITDWLKAIQLPPRFLFGLWLLGLLVLVLPSGPAGVFGVDVFREAYRKWIGLATLAALIFWCVQLVPFVQSRRRARATKARVIAAMASLAPEERLLLVYCLMQNQRTISLEITHRAATALTAKGILAMAAGVGDQLAWPYTIPDFVWQYLQVHPEVAYGDWSPDDPQLRRELQALHGHIHWHDRV